MEAKYMVLSLDAQDEWAIEEGALMVESTHESFTEAAKAYNELTLISNKYLVQVISKEEYI